MASGVKQFHFGRACSISGQVEPLRQRRRSPKNSSSAFTATPRGRIANSNACHESGGNFRLNFVHKLSRIWRQFGAGDAFIARARGIGGI